MKHILYRFNQRPSRLDHFPTSKSLVEWLETHRLPVDRSRNGLDTNIKTMLRATGQWVW